MCVGGGGGGLSTKHITCHEIEMNGFNPRGRLGGGEGFPVQMGIRGI